MMFWTDYIQVKQRKTPKYVIQYEVVAKKKKKITKS